MLLPDFRRATDDLFKERIAGWGNPLAIVRGSLVDNVGRTILLEALVAGGLDAPEHIRVLLASTHDVEHSGGFALDYAGGVRGSSLYDRQLGVLAHPMKIWAPPGQRLGQEPHDILHLSLSPDLPSSFGNLAITAVETSLYPPMLAQQEAA